MKESRLREATRAVWRHGYEVCRGQPWWEAVQPAVEAVLASLRRFADEANLQEHYWAPGDAPGELLRRRVTAVLSPDELLELEEACFWLRLRELRGGG